jgi:hypothetical protein
VAEPVRVVDVERTHRVVQVVEVRLEVPGRLPGGRAVASKVERDDPAAAREARGESREPVSPRVDAVEADERRRVRVAPLDVVEDRYSASSSPFPEGR